MIAAITPKKNHLEGLGQIRRFFGAMQSLNNAALNERALLERLLLFSPSRAHMTEKANDRKGKAQILGTQKYLSEEREETLLCKSFVFVFVIREDFSSSP